MLQEIFKTGSLHIIEKQYHYMIEFDRRGNSDAVFYSCDNKEFINFVEDMTGFKKAYGSFSDISVLMPAAKLSAVNLSSGYYNAHQLTEYVVYDEMMDTIAAAEVLIKEKCEKPFEYIARKYEYPTNYNVKSYGGYAPHGRYYNDTDRYGHGYYGNLLNDSDEYKDERLANMAMSDTDLELEVIVYDMNLCEQTLVATGETKAECWMNLFLENPNVRFNDVVDYSWG